MLSGFCSTCNTFTTKSRVFKAKTLIGTICFKGENFFAGRKVHCTANRKQPCSSCCHQIGSKLLIVEKRLQGMVADVEEENARAQWNFCKFESSRPAFMP